jgi:thiamine-monophosphate kinase
MGFGGELDLIRSIRARAGKSGGALRLGIGDDCAVLRPAAGHHILVTTDFSLEGRHFRRDWHPAASVGHRCLARGLSDLAAMGGKPMAAFLSLALPAGFLRRATGKRWLDGFMEGFLALSQASGAPLAGGDTSTAPGDAILADIVLLGSAPRGKELRRSTARPGDGLYVTGTLGGSAAELTLLAESPKRFAKAIASQSHPHLFPAPRLATGQRLRGLATAAMDISDGLSTDLHHLCEESGVGAIVDAAAIPLHPMLAAHTSSRQLQFALHGGEDYELLFTARPSARVPRKLAGVPITKIGVITTDRAILLRSGGVETALQAGGWEHTL